MSKYQLKITIPPEVVNRPRPPTNRDPGPWREVSSENGIRTVEVRNFDEFSAFVNVGFGDFDCNFIWRGQRRSEWKLTSTLSRTGQQDLSHLRNFSNAVARISGRQFEFEYSNSDKDVQARRQLWSLGQHHGLHTPLIDWTIYPYIALFFAFLESDQQTENGFRAVFALDSWNVSDVNFQITEGGGRLFKEQLKNPPYSEEFKQHLINRLCWRGDSREKMLESEIPAQYHDTLVKMNYAELKEKQLYIGKPAVSENRRIQSQGGMHVATPGDVPVEDWLFENRSRLKHPILVKILIPRSERPHILKCLNKMNISYLSLFPDFEGAAKYCNMALQESITSLGHREY